MSSPNADEEIKLIIGLGNPGERYKKTRHNIGFCVVEALAEKHGLLFKKAAQLKGELAKGEIEGKRALLFQPMTYMNESGEATRYVKDYYHIEQLENLVVVCDDVALPLGTIRLRAKGSSGGHNGLKSIEAHLGTQDYARLRLGVGYPEEGRVRDYVLDDFTQEELKRVEEVIVQATLALEMWMTMGIIVAMQSANKEEKK